MKVLVLNSGSSSLKYQLFDMEARVRLEGGAAERIGEPRVVLTHGARDESGQGREDVVELELPDHAVALHAIMERLSTRGAKDGLVAIGHRVVHGGREFREPQRIDDALHGERRLARARGGHQVDCEHPVAIQVFAVVRGDGVVLAQDILFNPEQPRVVLRRPAQGLPIL